MTKSSPVTKSTKSQPQKLQRLPNTYKIQKRPLLHPAIPSPFRNSTAQKVVYVSANSPFVSVVKRVRKFLNHIESRSSGPIDFSSGDKKVLAQIEAGVKDKDRGKSGNAGRGEEVLIKGTGKAIQKVLQLAIWWQGQEGIKVVIRTGSVGAVDDVVLREGKGEDGDVDGAEGGVEEEGDEVPESRVRRTSCLEVRISLR